MNPSFINLASWPLEIQLIFLVVPFALCIVGLAISGYVALSREFEVIDSFIQDNAYLEGIKRCWGIATYRARWRVVCAVCGFLTFPSLHLKAGVVKAEEIDIFPLRLRRKLVVSSWLVIVGSVWLAIAYAMVKTTDMPR